MKKVQLFGLTTICFLSLANQWSMGIRPSARCLAKKSAGVCELCECAEKGVCNFWVCWKEKVSQVIKFCAVK